MLDTKNKLKECLKREKKYYITGKKRHDQLVEWLVNDPSVRIWKYQKALRYTEYYFVRRELKDCLICGTEANEIV